MPENAMDNRPPAPVSLLSFYPDGALTALEADRGPIPRATVDRDNRNVPPTMLDRITECVTN